MPREYPTPTVEVSDEELHDMAFEALFGTAAGVDATDGCFVEPDGVCPHGHPSILLAKGMI